MIMLDFVMYFKELWYLYFYSKKQIFSFFFFFPGSICVFYCGVCIFITSILVFPCSPMFRFSRIKLPKFVWQKISFTKNVTVKNCISHS